MKVLDFSEFQPENIDWAKIKKAGYKVILRIGLRGSVPGNTARYRKIGYDYHFKKYLQGVIGAGIPYSVYFFPTPLSDAEADEEAAWIIGAVKGLTLSMPVYMDSEKVPGGCANDITTAQRTRYLKRITDKLVAAGIPCGIYASTSWLNNQIDMSQLQQCVRANTWVAQYAAKCTYTGPYVMWQYSSSAKVDGVDDGMDISVITGDFNMSCKKEQTADPVDVMIQIMENEVGYHEKASASSLDSKTGNSGSRNYTKYNKELHSIQPGNMDYPAAWCDAFFDWCILQLSRRFGYGAETARQVLCGDFDDYTYASVALYKKAGRWTQKPAKGYQIFFGGSGHTGGVVDVKGGKVYTIEGNKNDAVRECSYSVNDPNIIGYGMPKYGLLGETLAERTEEEGDYTMPLIKRGSKGKAVKILQIILGGLDVDGSFGWKTLNAVIAFQKKHGLEADGVVGPKTWRALLGTL